MYFIQIGIIEFSVKFIKKNIINHIEVSSQHSSKNPLAN